ncbi:hypothetical protein D9611_010896 [Ephemerocybe angulata]|uniref:F-box domain-containing protein n=1 Tax=Ephemerocybe angulata TaxID=980116 RepID=A0A8H5C601_9AGAR|nr:hypothetical protein D9611_010896 [Tulosesus angulatus]
MAAFCATQTASKWETSFIYKSVGSHDEPSSICRSPAPSIHFYPCESRMSSIDWSHLPRELKDILSSNHPLDEIETSYLKKAIFEQEFGIKRHLTEVDDLSLQISTLMEQKRAVMTEIARGEAVVIRCRQRLDVSISSLPPEILQMVFSHCIPCALQVCSEHASTYHNQPPHTLIQVCRQWRNIALDMPNLWASFSMRTFDESRLRMPRMIAFKQFVKRHYSRATGLPLSLDFYAESGKLILPADLPTLAEDSSRNISPASAVFNDDIELTNLSLGSADFGEGREGLLCEGLLCAIGKPSEWWTSERLTTVESLVLYSDMASPRMPRERVEIFSRKRLKSLRRLTLRIGDFLSTLELTPVFFIPWKNLTHVAITSWIPYHQWVEFFPKFTSLEQAVFYIIDSYGDIPVVPITTFPSLADLTLIYKPIASTAGISFETTHSFPSLKHLRLGAYDNPPNVPIFDLSSVQPVLSTLSSLSLHHLTWEAPVRFLVELLTATPNLRELSLGISTNYDQLFAHFQVDWDGHAVVPQLEEFTIDCTPTTYHGNTHRAPFLLVLTADGFTRMVKDRWKPIEMIRQLKKARLFLHGHERLLRTVKASLKEEMQEGLEVEVRSGKSPQWQDPFGRPVAHWHEGLVLPELSDCAECLKNRASREL